MNNQEKAGSLPADATAVPGRNLSMRKVWLDWIRVIAIALVLFNHLPGYALYQDGGAGRPFYLFLSLLTGINVPLLLMISGTLLLDREESVRQILKKRVLRIAVVLFLAYLGLYLLRLGHDWILHGEPFVFSVSAFLLGAASNSLIPADAGPYWYLYAYLGFLLMLPFLRGAARNTCREHFLLLAALHAMLFTLLPLLNLFLPENGRLVLSSSFSVPLAAEQVFFYPFMGCWLDRNADIVNMKRKTVVLTALTGLAAAGAADLCAMLTAPPSGALAKSYLTMFNWITVLCAFLVIKRLVLVTFPGLSRGRSAKRIAMLSSLCFGVYLFDPWLKLILFGAYYKVASVLPVLLYSVLWIPVSMAAGGALTWIVRKIPGVGRLL